MSLALWSARYGCAAVLNMIHVTETSADLSRKSTGCEPAPWRENGLNEPFGAARVEQPIPLIIKPIEEGRRGWAVRAEGCARSNAVLPL